MKTKNEPMYLTQGDAFNLESACALMISQTMDEGVRNTFLELEQRLRHHQGMIVSTKTSEVRENDSN